MATDDPEDWMWERARSLLESAERMKRRAFAVAEGGAQAPVFQPPIDVFENASGLWVLVALPGVCAEHVLVTLANDHLAVEGQRVLPDMFRHSQVHRLESPYGRFFRRVDLPQGRFVLEQKELVQGCLVLRLARLTTGH
jgi:HSP20 family protein